MTNVSWSWQVICQVSSYFTLFHCDLVFVPDFYVKVTHTELEFFFIKLLKFRSNFSNPQGFLCRQTQMPINRNTALSRLLPSGLFQYSLSLWSKPEGSPRTLVESQKWIKGGRPWSSTWTLLFISSPFSFHPSLHKSFSSPPLQTLLPLPTFFSHSFLFLWMHS